MTIRNFLEKVRRFLWITADKAVEENWTYGTPWSKLSILYVHITVITHNSKLYNMYFLNKDQAFDLFWFIQGIGDIIFDEDRLIKMSYSDKRNGE